MFRLLVLGAFSVVAFVACHIDGGEEGQLKSGTASCSELDAAKSKLVEEQQKLEEMTEKLSGYQEQLSNQQAFVDNSKAKEDELQQKMQDSLEAFNNKLDDYLGADDSQTDNLKRNVRTQAENVKIASSNKFLNITNAGRAQRMIDKLKEFKKGDKLTYTDKNGEKINITTKAKADELRATLRSQKLSYDEAAQKEEKNREEMMLKIAQNASEVANRSSYSNKDVVAKNIVILAKNLNADAHNRYIFGTNLDISKNNVEVLQKDISTLNENIKITEDAIESLEKKIAELESWCNS